MTVSGQGFGGAAYSLAIRLGLTSAESSSTSPLSSDFLYRKYTRLPEIFQGSLSSDFLFLIGNMLGSSIQCLSMSLWEEYQGSDVWEEYQGSDVWD